MTAVAQKLHQFVHPLVPTGGRGFAPVLRLLLVVGFLAVSVVIAVGIVALINVITRPNCEALPLIWRDVPTAFTSSLRTCAAGGLSSVSFGGALGAIVLGWSGWRVLKALPPVVGFVIGRPDAKLSIELGDELRELIDNLRSPISSLGTQASAVTPAMASVGIFIGGEMASTAVAESVANGREEPVIVALADPSDLMVEHLTGPNPVEPGQIVEFRVVVTNNGPGTAKNVRVVDRLPTGVTRLPSPGDSITNGERIWLIDSLGSGSKDTVRVRVRVNADASGQLTDSVLVVGARDPNRDNNVTTLVIPVRAPPLPRLPAYGALRVLAGVTTTRVRTPIADRRADSADVRVEPGHPESPQVLHGPNDTLVQAVTSHLNSVVSRPDVYRATRSQLVSRVRRGWITRTDSVAVDTTPRPAPLSPPEIWDAPRSQVIVRFRAVIDQMGRVDPSSVWIEDLTDPSFASRAYDLIRRWKFEPGWRNGASVPTAITGELLVTPVLRMARR